MNVYVNPARNKALGLGRRGHAILPVWGTDGSKCACGRPGCESAGKHPIGPLVPHGLTEATTDGGIISEWFDEYPDMNYGIVTDNLPTIDIDPRNGGDVAWKKLVAGNYEPHTWMVATGGGGRHIMCGSVETPTPSAKLARGVDLKGVGGYVVGPGSLHASGKRYAFYKDCRPKETPLQPIPEWVRRVANGTKNGNGKAPLSSLELQALVEDAFEGERNHRITKLFGHLYGAVRPDKAVLCRLVIAWNDSHCHPPLTHDEVISIAESIVKCERKKRAL
jgi:hypothetical protein